MEEIILCYIRRMHTGRDYAVSSPELERRFGLRGATLRKHINTLRCRGYPICSDESGYYYAASYMELSDTIRQLNSRIVKIARNIGDEGAVDFKAVNWQVLQVGHG